jgi:hypothetical protein
MCCTVHIGLLRVLDVVRFLLQCIVCNNAVMIFVVFLACVWIHHKQLFCKLLVENRYFVSVPVFEHWKQVTGSRDCGIASPIWNVGQMCPHEGVQLMPTTASSSMWDFLMPQFWLHVQQCRAALCCTRVTWKAVQSGTLLH